MAQGKVKTNITWVGDIELVFTCEQCEGEYLDTTVKINGIQLMCITWADRDKFIQDFTTLSLRYRI